MYNPDVHPFIRLCWNFLQQEEGELAMRNPGKAIMGSFLVVSIMVSTAALAVTKPRGSNRQPQRTRSNFVPKPQAPASFTQNESHSKPAAKVILVLQTREHLITVLSGEKELRYSVVTNKGMALAENLSAPALRSRFPDLHDILTGIAWAGP
jgi:hypothetical protein